MKYQALLCDMDGTLLDTEPIYYQHFKEQLSPRELTPAMFKAQIGLGSQEGSKIMVEQYYTDLKASEYLKIIDLELFHTRLLNGDLMPTTMPYLEKFLRAFQGSLKYAIATGSPSDVVQMARDKFGFDQYFEVYTSRDEVEHGKPHPQIYIETAKRLGVEIEKCIVLEDSLMGVRSGVASGAYTIAIPNDWTNHMDFSEAHYVCDSLKSSIDHIKKICKF